MSTASMQKLDLGLELRPGETIEVSERGWFFSNKALLILCIVLVIGTLGFGIIAVPVLLISRLWQRRTSVVITNQRLIITKGIIGRSQKIVERSRIQNVDITQGPIGRWQDYGTIVIETAGSTVTVRVGTIAHPRVIRDAVTALPA